MSVPRRILSLLLVIASASSALPALAQAGPDLHAYSVARFVPFANATESEQAFRDAPRLSVSVQTPVGNESRVFSMTMDSGSTGVVISAADLPNYSPRSNPEGWEFLSSSKRLWVGHWVQSRIEFVSTAGETLVTAEVPVLAVEVEYDCPSWSEKANQPNCAAPRSTTEMPRGIAYLGVGFGREHDGQPQGTPDKNPFLNVTAIDGQPIVHDRYRSGYVITQNGVHIGLSSTNSQGFGWSKLQGRSLGKGGTPASNDPRDWPEARMSVSVNGEPAQPGAVLVDTGIAQMYLDVPDPSQLPTQPVVDPSRQDVKAIGLIPGTTVNVSFPDASHPIARYAFAADDGQELDAPTAVLVNSSTPFAFVNTGRHFLRSFDLAFDANGGWFGLRKVDPRVSP